MKNRDQIDRPGDDNRSSAQGTWIIRPRRAKKHHDQMRLPLDDIDDDVDLQKLSDTEFKELLLGDDLDARPEDRPDQTASAAFGRPLTDQESRELMEELDRAVEAMLAELDSGE